MENKSKINFIIGIILGINISILGLLFYFSTSKSMAVSEDAKEQIQALSVENTALKAQLEKLAKQEETKAKEDETIKANQTISLEISKDMSYNEIADLLVDNNVYPYKNDLIMIFELLNFDRYNVSIVLQKYGIINNSKELNAALKSIESRSSAVSEALYASKLIQDKKSFMKLIYLGNLNTKIKFGQKHFKTGSSLREVCDVLMQ